MSEQSNPDPRRDRARRSASNPVILFMKGTPEQPMCGFSARTVAALQALDAPFAAVDILPDPRIRQELSALSQLADDPAAVRQRRARRRLRHRHRDVRERRAGRGARRRAASGARARGAARRRRAAHGHREPPVLTVARRPARARVRWRHVRRDAAPPGPALGRPAPGHPRPDAPARRRGVAGARGRGGHGAGDPAPGRARRAADRRRGRLRAGDGGRAPARPRHAGDGLGAPALGARPTAVNLAYAVDRVRAAALAAGPVSMAGAARAEAERIHAEEDAASAAIAAHGADLLRRARRGSPRTATPARWPPAAAAPRWR